MSAKIGRVFIVLSALKLIYTISYFTYRPYYGKHSNYYFMADLHDIIAFSSKGEKIVGIVVEHYSNPLDDYYVVYADYALHKVLNPDEDAQIIIENVIIPACDEALADYRLKRQQLKDINNYHQEIETLIEALKAKIDIGSIFEE